MMPRIKMGTDEMEAEDFKVKVEDMEIDDIESEMLPSADSRCSHCNSLLSVATQSGSREDSATAPDLKDRTTHETTDAGTQTDPELWTQHPSAPQNPIMEYSTDDLSLLRRNRSPAPQVRIAPLSEMTTPVRKHRASNPTTPTSGRKGRSPKKNSVLQSLNKTMNSTGKGSNTSWRSFERAYG
jgi:hypothetical protein